MKNIIEYKGFTGSVEIDIETKTFVGELLNIKNDLIVYEGINYNEFIKNFHNAVDDYIEFMKINNKVNINQFKGSFNVRVNPEVHRDASIFAKQHCISLNKLVEAAIKEKIYAK